MSVLLQTTIGEIVIDLHVEKCPKSSANFLKLCKLKYYHWTCCHSLQADFIASFGDPSETGKGGECADYQINQKSKVFNPEIRKEYHHDKIGVVSYVTTTQDGLPYAGSQFMITLTESKLDYLDGKQAIFGQVVEGLDILEKLNLTLVDASNRPFVDIRILHTVILDDPFPDPPGLVEPPESPKPSEKVLKSLRSAETEAEKNLTPEEIARKAQLDEINARALTLEMVGDLPFADIKPPENILFVCKLNPITRDEDLEIIFGRFGKIVSCEIIRDKQTGDSLGYAFIEYENQQDCEDAYAKMDNVLIDDRRIKVDFSQSVSKLQVPSTSSFSKKAGYFGVGLEKKSKYRDQKGGNEKDYALVFDSAGKSEKRRNRSRDRATYRQKEFDQKLDKEIGRRSNPRDKERPSRSRERGMRSRSRDRSRRSWSRDRERRPRSRSKDRGRRSRSRSRDRGRRSRSRSRDRKRENRGRESNRD